MHRDGIAVKSDFGNKLTLGLGGAYRSFSLGRDGLGSAVLLFFDGFFQDPGDKPTDRHVIIELAPMVYPPCGAVLLVDKLKPFAEPVLLVFKLATHSFKLFYGAVPNSLGPSYLLLGAFQLRQAKLLILLSTLGGLPFPETGVTHLFFSLLDPPFSLAPGASEPKGFFVSAAMSYCVARHSPFPPPDTP
jgi:hypothetical protein